MSCPQCLSGTGPDAALCASCARPAASASQFPRTPGDQYIPSAASGQHGPPASAPPREFRLDPRRLSRSTALLITGYLLLWSGWGELPFLRPAAHETLLAGTGLQFVLVLGAFLDVPRPGLDRETGAYLAVAAAALAALPAALSVLGPRRGHR